MRLTKDEARILAQALNEYKYNDDISNLCLVSRKDLAKLNRNHAKLSPELKEVQILINQIKQKVK